MGEEYYILATWTANNTFWFTNDGIYPQRNLVQYRLDPIYLPPENSLQ